MSKKLIDRPTEIRDDEKLNNSKLFEYLSEIIDLDIESFDILQFPSGYSNLTYLIKSNEKEYVLRKPPHGAKIKSGHDMSREFKVLSSLNCLSSSLSSSIFLSCFILCSSAFKTLAL